MGTDIQTGQSFTDGQLVHGSDINAAINNAALLSTTISARTLKTTMSLGDELLINDTGTLKKVSGQQFVTLTAVPTGCMMDYAGLTEPLGWVFCYGQSLSTTTYAALFAVIAYTYGGSGATFMVPDCRGRVAAGDDNMGGTAAGRISTAGSGFDGTVLGGTGGSQSITMTTAQMPSHTHAGVDHLHSTSTPDHTHTVPNHVHGITVFPSYQTVRDDLLMKRVVQWDTQTGGSTAGSGAFQTSGSDRSLASTTGAADRSLTTGATGGGTGITNVQPTIMLNKIIKT